jgi:hypothetical protein
MTKGVVAPAKESKEAKGAHLGEKAAKLGLYN